MGDLIGEPELLDSGRRVTAADVRYSEQVSFFIAVDQDSQLGQLLEVLLDWAHVLGLPIS